MGTSVIFKPTAVQEKALALLKGSAKHILLFGGSRSGKTTIIVMTIIYRACRYAGSRHLICRLRAKDARSSVLHETLIPWLDKTIGDSSYKLNVHDGVVRLWNGSEIWIGGLGDKEQVDRILGHEYVTIYFNEISQLAYSAVNTAYSRLAMNVAGCANKFFYDCNPGSPLHWAYKIFVRKLEPRTDARLEKPDLYDCMVLNPADNAENLADGYIEDILDNMPEKQRARFRDGLWVKPDGVVYDRFDEDMVIATADMPKEFDRICGGQDFGLHIAAVKIGWLGDTVYIMADSGGFNMTTRTFVETQNERQWYSDVFPTYCDPAGGERIQEIPNGARANNSVDAGIDYISALMERKKFFVCAECTGVLGEIWDYMRDENNCIVKLNDHYMDAMRYAVFSGATGGVVLQ